VSTWPQLTNTSVAMHTYHQTLRNAPREIQTQTQTQTHKHTAS